MFSILRNLKERISYTVESNMTTQFPVKKKSEKFSERMAKKTKLSEAEIDRLVHIFRQITVSSVV